MYDVDEILEKNPLKEVVGKYVNLSHKDGEYWGICPFHEEKTPSFTVVPSKGFFHCHGCGAHGSQIDFVKSIHNVGFREACAILDGKSKPASEIKKKAPALKSEPDLYEGLTPVGGSIEILPSGEAYSVYSPKKSKFVKLKPKDVYTYKAMDGSVVGYIFRLEIDGKKLPLPIQMVEKDGQVFPCNMAFSKPRPLFGMETLSNPGEVYIVEGEKSAEALMKILPNSPVISWSMGSKSVKYADWSSLPEGRDYVLIPDADYKSYPTGHERAGELMPMEEQVGYKAMKAVQSMLPSPKTAEIVNTHHMGKVKDGWDVADTDFDEVSFKEWLDKCMGRAEKEVEVKIKKRKNKVNYDDTYFKCLGFHNRLFYFYHKPTGQLHAFSAKEISKSQMIMLAPLEWWEDMFPKGKAGVDWDAVLNAYLRIQEKVGVFDEKCVRGRGAWIDEGRALLHLGNKLIVDGQDVELHDFDSQYIYKKDASLSVSYGAFLPAEESKRFVEVCRLVRWEKPSFGDLLAGWIFASLVCGVMPFRSHAYITGGSGSGKSWVMDNIVRMFMGKMAFECAGSTSESGIRKNLKGDVRPVIFNESEAEDSFALKRVQGVIELARMASDENAAPILKGSGEGESFICRSSFLFASINKTTSKSADENRTIFLEIADSPVKASQEVKDADNKKFKMLERKAMEISTPEYIGSLLTRAVELIPVMRKSHEIISDVGARVTGSRRTGSSLAMPLCGLHALMSDNVITEEEAKQYIEKFVVETDKSDFTESQEEQCLDKLMFTEIKAEDKDKFMRSIQVAEVVTILSGRADSTNGFNRKSLDDAMRSRGVMIKDGFLWLASKQDALPAKAFKGTQFETGWKEALRRLEGVESFGCTYFGKTLKTSGVKIPVKTIIETDLLGEPNVF